MDDVLGPKNPRIQHLRRLSGRRRARAEANEFVIDGPVLLAEALDAGIAVREVFVTVDASSGDAAAAARSAGVDVRVVRDGVLDAATDTVASQGVAAIGAIPDATEPAALGDFVLVLVGLADPGNAGTLLRVAEAAGASGILSCDDGVDLWSPKAVRASAGAVFRVPIAVVGDPVDAVERLRDGGVTVVATTLEGTSLDDVDLTGPVAVCLGNEAHGLAPAVVAAADLAVRIPMAGRVESLNVAMAGSVVAFETARQRRRNP